MHSEVMRSVLVRSAFVLSFVMSILVAAPSAAQEFTLDVELGGALPLYNDVAVPNDATRFSLVDGWVSRASFAPRIRLNAVFGQRHEVSALYAPLTSKSHGDTGGFIEFAGDTFDGRRFLDARYRFDSYRLAYRYRLINREDALLSIGASAKVRSATIELSQDGRSAEKTDLGVVPLISLQAEYWFSPAASVVFDGDGLVGPQGRAADVFTGLQFVARDNMNIRLGARLLEGGADVDEVYSFAAFIYGVVGLRLLL
jgi:hypothetical protein